MVFSVFSYEAVLTSELDFSLFVTAGGPSVLRSDASFEIIAASLNPIENLWSIIDLRTEDREPKNEEELFEILKEAWESIPPHILENLVESMPRRCQDVINSKGYPIKY